MLIQLLVAFGSVIGRKPYVLVGRTWHHANEDALLIGPTSAARKGQSWDEVRSCLRDVDADWLSNIATGLSSAEGLIYAVRDPVMTREPVKEKGRIIDYQDVTTDPGVEDKRLLVFESEFGSVLKRASREGNALTAVLRQAWDGSCLRTLTKGSPYKATGAHVSVIAHVTLEELLSLLAEVDIANGFINRFLLACVRRIKLLPFGGRVPQDEMDRLRVKLKAAVEFARTVDEVEWTRPAQDLWEHEYARLTAERPGAFGKATSRAEAHALRLAMKSALINQSNKIELVHLQTALALWDYCERSAAHVFGDRTDDRDADRILATLRAARDGLTRSEIRRGVFGDHKPADFVAAKLGLLLRSGLVRREIVPTEGRSAERWQAIRRAEPDAWSVKSVRSVISPPQLPPSHANHAYHVSRNAEVADPEREVFEL
jgi:hypothetical protein